MGAALGCRCPQFPGAERMTEGEVAVVTAMKILLGGLVGQRSSSGIGLGGLDIDTCPETAAVVPPPSPYAIDASSSSSPRIHRHRRWCNAVVAFLVFALFAAAPPPF